jgi:23S rRNA (adenine2030-N6)-methyltransferase
MNYRHAYHAGNFADVVKHAVLALIIEHMKAKPAPFRVVDTHAGVGLYDLHGEQAQKTGEWREGIARVTAAKFSPEAAAALAPYLRVVDEINHGGDIREYPGSPLLAARLLRREDRLVLNELHPEDHDELHSLFARDHRVKVLSLDAWTALKSLLPPPERRGVVLIDPAFEQPGELDRLAHGLKEAHRRFATGTILMWYPIKDISAVSAFRKSVHELGLAKVLVVEIAVRKVANGTPLSSAGLIIVNAPYKLHEKLNALLPELVGVLAQGAGAGFKLDNIGKELS